MSHNHIDTFSNAMFDSLPGNCVVIDKTSTIVKANQSWNNFATENSKGALIECTGKNFLEVCKQLTDIRSKDQDEVCERINTILKGEESAFDMEYQGQKLGESLWFRIQASSFESDGTTYATIILEDVTLKVDSILTEISRKNLSEHQSEKGELDFNLLVNSSPGVTYKCCLDDPWEMHFISDKIETLSGYPKEDFLGLTPIRPFGEIMHPDDREEASRLVQIAIKKKESYKLAYRVIHKDGHINYVFGYGQANYKSDGSPDYLVGVIFNDTDRVVAVNKVKESEERFRATFEQAAVGIAHFSLEGEFLRVNKKYCDILGYAYDELILKTARDISLPEDLEQDAIYIAEIIQGKKKDLSIERRFLNKNGGIVWAQLTVSLVCDSLKEPEYFLAVIEAINDKKDAQIKLIESEERFRNLIEQAPFSIKVLNLEGFIIDYNKSWKELWGISDEMAQAVLSTYNILKDPEAHRLGLMPYIKKAFGGETITLPIIETNAGETLVEMGVEGVLNQKKFVQTILYPVKDDKDQVFGVIGMEEDITERKLAEEKLQQSEKDFRDLVEQNPLFIEIYNPVGQLIHLNNAYKNLLAIDEDLSQMLYSNYNLFEDEYAIENGLGPGIKNVFAGEYFDFNEYEFDIDLVRSWLELENKNWGKIWCKTTGFPIKDENGNIKHLVFLSQDVSSRVNAEKELKGARSFTDKLVQTANVMIVGLDAQGKVNLFNPAAERITGYTLAELQGKNWFEELVPKEKYPKVHKEFSRLMEQGDVSSFQNPILTKGGQEKYISWSNSTIPIGDKSHGILSFGQDVTEQKIAENALVESENKFRALFDSGGYAMSFAKSSDGIIAIVNQAWLSLFGYSNDSDVVGRLATDFISPKERKRIMEMSRLRITGDAPNHYNTIGLRKDGSSFDLEIRVTQFEMEGEKYALVMMADITKRLEAERKIRVSEENYRTLIEQANDGIVVIQDGTLRFVNTALTKITGYSTAELLNSHFLNFIESSEIEKVKANYAKRMKGDSVPPYESKIIRKDGETIEVEFNGGITNYNDTAADITMVRDNTERKKAIETRDRLFNLSQDLIGISSLETGQFIYVNEAWKTVLGYTNDEFVSKTIFDFILPEDHKKTWKEIESLKKGINSMDFEDRFIHKDGSVIDFAWTATPLVEEGLFYAIGRNITDRKKVDRQVMQYQNRLKDQAIELTLTEEKQRKQIANDLHDHVGQILASNRMQIAAMTDKMQKAELLSGMQNVSKGLLNALKTTRSLIFDLSPPQLNEIGLYAATADWIEEEIEEKYGIKTSTSCEGDITIKDNNLRILLFRCIRELLINVVKHAKANKVDVLFTQQYGNLIVYVKDNGVGFNFNPEMLRLKNTGFGLFSVIERVEDMGGSVNVESKPGKGVSICLSIPINQ